MILAIHSVGKENAGKETRFVFVVGFAQAVTACDATSNVLDHLPIQATMSVWLCVIELCVAAAFFLVTFLENIFAKTFSDGLPWATLVIGGLVMLFKIFQLSGELDLPAKIFPFIFGAVSAALATFATTLPLVFHS